MPEKFYKEYDRANTPMNTEEGEDNQGDRFVEHQNPHEELAPSAEEVVLAKNKTEEEDIAPDDVDEVVGPSDGSVDLDEEREKAERLAQIRAKAEAMETATAEPVENIEDVEDHNEGFLDKFLKGIGLGRASAVETRTTNPEGRSDESDGGQKPRQKRNGGQKPRYKDERKEQSISQ